MAGPNYKQKNTIGAERKAGLRYNDVAKADKQIVVSPIPSRVLTAGEATTGIKVGIGNICRIFGTANDFVFFGSEIPASAPVATDQNALQLGATVITVVATDEFIRCSAGVTRVEVTED